MLSCLVVSPVSATREISAEPTATFATSIPGTDGNNRSHSGDVGDGDSGYDTDTSSSSSSSSSNESIESTEIVMSQGNAANTACAEHGLDLNRNITEIGGGVGAARENVTMMETTFSAPITDRGARLGNKKNDVARSSTDSSTAISDSDSSSSSSSSEDDAMISTSGNSMIKVSIVAHPFPVISCFPPSFFFESFLLHC